MSEEKKRRRPKAMRSKKAKDIKNDINTEVEDNYTVATSSIGDSAKFSLTKDQIARIVKAMKPVVREDKFKVEVNPAGSNIIVSVDEQGFQIGVNLGVQTIKTNEKFVFYIDKSILQRLSGIVADEIKFDITSENMKLDIAGTALNLGLTIEEFDVDLNYKSDISEVKPNDWLSEMLNRISVSKIADGSPLAPVIALGKDIRYGSLKNLSLYKKGFSKINVNVLPEFVNFMKNATTLGDNIEFIQDNENKQFIVKVDNVIYKTSMLDIQFPADVAKMLEELESESTAEFSRTNLLLSLERLSIPLIGAKTPEINIAFQEDKQNAWVVVYSVGNQASNDIWEASFVEGTSSAIVNIYNLMGALGVVDENVTIINYQNFLVVRDTVQDILLAKYL